jgi:hypothetical protein
MSRPRINVVDNEKWGRLVKTWATGKNYVDHRVTAETPFPTEVEAPPKFPKPTSFKDFVTQCETAQVGLFFEDGQDNPPVTADEDMGLVVLQVTSETMVLRLPAKEKIEESERNLELGNEYVLPRFYRRIFGDRNPEPQDDAGKAVLHAERVGEYTINTCM